MSPVICEALAVKEDRRVRTKVTQSGSSSNLSNQGNKAEVGAMDVDTTEDHQKQFIASEIAPSSSQVK